MSVTDLIRQQGSTATATPRSPQELVARYQRMRAVSTRLNNMLIQRLAADALREGGRKLGLLHDNTFVFDSEDETAVLMDYCLYHVQRNGRNAIEQYVSDHPPVAGTDEATCLRAMQDAIYSLFRVDAAEPDVGVAVTDVATDRQYLLVDIGLSRSATPGTVFFSRLLLFDDFATTNGAAIPLGQLPPEELPAFGADWKRVAAAQPADYDPAPLIRECLQRGMTHQTRYLDPPRSTLPPPLTADERRKRRAALRKLSNKSGGNRRCRCGSGKMFKNCCMKKPR